MQLLPCSTVPIDALIGSHALNPNGYGYRIEGIRLDLESLKIKLVLRDLEFPENGLCELEYDSMSDWSLQLGQLED